MLASEDQSVEGATHPEDLLERLNRAKRLSHPGNVAAYEDWLAVIKKLEGLIQETNIPIDDLSQILLFFIDNKALL